jgi:hypothetical protein
MTFAIITKARRPKIATPARVEALSARMASALKVDFLHGIQSFKARANRDSMREAFLAKDYKAVMRSVPWKDMDKDLDLGRLGDAMRSGAIAAKREIAMPSTFRYGLTNPKIDAYVKNRTGELITTSEKGMLEAVRAATARSVSHALTPQQVADEIRGSIGLNEPQARALANYRSGMASAKEAIAPDEQEARADSYRERLLDQRATMIGRTEVRFAENAGQQEVWESADEQGFIPDTALRVWKVDGNPCPQICRPMNNVPTGLREPWTLPDGREVMLPTESHPNCFCIAILDISG